MASSARLAAETLTLTHTMGVTGWQVAHAGSASACVLAAVGLCFAQRRLAMNLALVWRLRSIWRMDAATLEPRELRLALAVPPAVKVAEPVLQVELQGAAGAPLAVTLPLLLDVAAAPADEAPKDTVWRVLSLDPRAFTAFRKLARVLPAVARGSRLTLRAAARTAVPTAWRSAFPLRVELAVTRAEGWLTLVPARTLDLTRTAAVRAA